MEEVDEIAGARFLMTSFITISIVIIENSLLRKWSGRLLTGGAGVTYKIKSRLEDLTPMRILRCLNQQKIIKQQ